MYRNGHLRKQVTAESTFTLPEGVMLVAQAYLHTSMVQGEPPHVLRPVSFDSIVIDEAAQASEPDVVLAATSASCRVIVVGDHKQLGPGVG